MKKVMHSPAFNLEDKWLRLLGIPLVAILGNIIFYQPDNDLQGISQLKALLMSLLECVSMWELVRLGILRARKLYPLLKQTRPRIIYQIVWFSVAIVLLRVSTLYFYDLVNFWGHPISFRSYWVSVVVAFLFIIPIAAIYEGIYLYRQWWLTYYEAEQLKKENLQSQLDSLKAQISPHFLFNSLSTLSSLVSEDPKRAEWFIEELASVYRYLLQNNEQPLTTLENELNFIQAYFHLLQTRFGKGIELELQVDEGYYAYLLPPLTLQLLVENAVKHNAVSASKPLIIRIHTDEVNNLYVLNTIRKKTMPVVSDGTGLRNIREKFRLLRQPEVIVKQTDECFQVMIPLLKSAAYEFLTH
jgi:hypothetical protein